MKKLSTRSSRPQQQHRVKFILLFKKTPSRFFVTSSTTVRRRQFNIPFSRDLICISRLNAIDI